MRRGPYANVRAIRLDDQMQVPEKRPILMEQRPPRVAINIEQTKDKPCQVSPSHADALGWQTRLTNALGTSSHEFVDIELARLVTIDALVGTAEALLPAALDRNER